MKVRKIVTFGNEAFYKKNFKCSIDLIYKFQNQSSLVGLKMNEAMVIVICYFPKEKHCNPVENIGTFIVIISLNIP